MITHKPFKPVDKILLVLQFWEGDKKQAMELARFIADLQPVRNEQADFLFISRFDCAHDHATIGHVAKKFNVHYYTSRRRGVGWPHGCNELWFAGMEWFYGMKEGRKTPQYKAAFTFEADGVPLAPNWVHQMSRDWDEENAKHKTFVYGALLMAPGPHVNGNAMFSGDPAFLHWVTRKVGGSPVMAGWDYVMYRDFQKWGAFDYPKLKSYWQLKTATSLMFNNELARGTVWLHGVKDSSLLNMARKKFLG